MAALMALSLSPAMAAAPATAIAVWPMTMPGRSAGPGKSAGAA